MKKLIGFFVKQKIFSDLIVVFVVVLGISCILLMRREAFPNIKFDILVVNTLFPGASPDEVERLITNPLEMELKEVSGIKKINSVSRANTSMIILQLDPDQTTESEAKIDVQDVIDRFKDIPESAERPVVTSLDGGSYPVVQVSLTGEVTPIELRAYANEIENDLESLPSVAKIVPTGMQDLEIHVELSPEKLSSHHLSFEEVINSLRNQNLSIPGGSISGGAQKEELHVRTIGSYENLSDIENTVVRANDLAHAIRVRDVATVGFKLKYQDRLFRTNGSHAINLTVLRKKGGDSISLVNDVKERVEQLTKKYDGILNFRILDDESIWIKMRLNTLTTNFLIGLLLVLATLSFLLPPIIAILVALGIPFAFMATMIVFYNLDYSLNLLSMLGLIIVIGMLVDDAVVAVENSMRLFEDGMSAEEAAIEGTCQVSAAVFGSVMTTVLAFLPLMFMTGIFGKFVQFIPMGVIVALLVSLLEVYFILPNHFVRWVTRTHEKRKLNLLDRLYSKSHSFWISRVVPRYENWIEFLVYRRYRVLGLLGLFFVFSIFLATRLNFVLFPAEGIEIFFVTAETPIGTSLEETSSRIKPLEELVSALPAEEVQDFTTQVGMQQKDPGDPGTKYASHVAMLVVYLKPAKERKRKAGEIIEELRKASRQISDLKIGFEKVNPGPPVGKPISIGIQGDQYEEILKLAQEIKNELAQFGGTSDLEINYQQGNKEIIVELISSEAAAAGVTVASVGQSVRAAFEGIVATSIKKLSEEIDIRVLLPDKSAVGLKTVQSIKVPNQLGQLIPLNQVARFREDQGVAAHIHENYHREVRILGQIDSKVTDAVRVNQHIQKMLPKFNERYPNLKVIFGGENEDTQESMRSLMRTFGLAFVGIFIVLILLFQQMWQPILVGLTIPLGAISVMITLFLHREPLSFMGMLGVIALSGVIVNNAIVLVDCVNQLRRGGAELIESIVKAATMRLRPIFLTTVTTVVGILPTAYGIGGQDEFVKPIALALGWGLLLGSTLTVFIFPSMIAILDDFIRKLKGFFVSAK